MTYAKAAGYPVPDVKSLSDDGIDLVMERAPGLPMLHALQSTPWRLGYYAEMLASLHDELHGIESPSWLAPAPGPEGDRLVHLDLHPVNVIVSRRGPVVIDWTNAARGSPAIDVAVSWLLMGAARIPGRLAKRAFLGAFRSALVRSFTGHFDLDPVRLCLPVAVEWKCADRNMAKSERTAMAELAGAEERKVARRTWQAGPPSEPGG